jgi:hypothetical protein
VFPLQLITNGELPEKIMQVFMSVLNATDDEIKSWGSTVRMDRTRAYNAINEWVSVSYPLPYPIPDCNLSLFEKYFDTLPAGTKSLKTFFETFKGVRKRKVLKYSCFLSFFLGGSAGLYIEPGKMHIIPPLDRPIELEKYGHNCSQRHIRTEKWTSNEKKDHILRKMAVRPSYLSDSIYTWSIKTIMCIFLLMLMSRIFFPFTVLRRK